MCRVVKDEPSTLNITMASNSKSWHTDWALSNGYKGVPHFALFLIPPQGQMMGMVSWQGIFPNFTQSVSCQSSLTQLDLMMEVGYKKTWRPTMHSIIQVAGFCLTTSNYKQLRKASKRPTGDGDESNSSSDKAPWRSPTPQKAECFLCKEEGDEVREANIKLNKRVDECAKTCMPWRRFGTQWPSSIQVRPQL